MWNINFEIILQLRLFRKMIPCHLLFQTGGISSGIRFRVQQHLLQLRHKAIFFQLDFIDQAGDWVCAVCACHSSIHRHVQGVKWPLVMCWQLQGVRYRNDVVSMLEIGLRLNLLFLLFKRERLSPMNTSRKDMTFLKLFKSYPTCPTFHFNCLSEQENNAFRGLRL